MARTATNIRNGGNSPIAGVVHAVLLILVLLFLAPLAASIPLATLAAILFMVAWNMSEIRHVVKMVRRAPRADRSEEHTSELQSLMRISYAVFCLKKKKTSIKDKVP